MHRYLTPFFAACCVSVHMASRDMMRASRGLEYQGASATSRLKLRSLCGSWSMLSLKHTHTHAHTYTHTRTRTHKHIHVDAHARTHMQEDH